MDKDERGMNLVTEALNGLVAGFIEEGFDFEDLTMVVVRMSVIFHKMAQDRLPEETLKNVEQTMARELIGMMQSFECVHMVDLNQPEDEKDVN